MKIPNILSVLAFAALAGCTSFEPLRTARYVDEANNYLSVEYGETDKPHKSVFRLSNGNTWNYESKLVVRVYLPDGDDFLAYRHMSEVGNLYVSDDEEWEFLERGPNCILARKAKKGKGYVPFYRGALCGTQRVRREETNGRGSHAYSDGTRQTSDKRLKTR